MTENANPPRVYEPFGPALGAGAAHEGLARLLDDCAALARAQGLCPEGGALGAAILERLRRAEQYAASLFSQQEARPTVATPARLQ
jgi:hypothetical protein